MFIDIDLLASLLLLLLLLLLVEMYSLNFFMGMRHFVTPHHHRIAV
jgi:hypothetical protein